MERGPKDDRLIATEQGLTVLLDTRLTEELIQEGLAREVINRVQTFRKNAGLKITDRIALDLVVEGPIQLAAMKFQDYIARETLASTINIASPSETLINVGKTESVFEVDESTLRILLSVVS
jgi:isoleucyl-tRNA synthetase